MTRRSVSKPSSARSKRVDPFYRSREWIALRGKILLRDRRRCRMCGAHVPCHGHVDHIIPRKAAPERALDPSNLQLLCERCHNGPKRYHELNETVEHGLDGFPVGSEWS